MEFIHFEEFEIFDSLWVQNMSLIVLSFWISSLFGVHLAHFWSAPSTRALSSASLSCSSWTYIEQDAIKTQWHNMIEYIVTGHPGIHQDFRADSPVLFNNHPPLSHTCRRSSTALSWKCQTATEVKSAALPPAEDRPAEYGFPASLVLFYRLLFCISSSAGWLSASEAQFSLNQEA